MFSLIFLLFSFAFNKKGEEKNLQKIYEKKNWILFAMNCIDLIKHEKNIPVEKFFFLFIIFCFIFLSLDFWSKVI